MASISPASSSNERPSVPPAPAVSSKCSSQWPVSDSASLTSLPDLAIALLTLPCFAEPAWSTTPRARIPSPTRSDWMSEARVLLRISRSVVAVLRRYTAWIRTASIGLSSIASRNAAKSSSV